jgi:hypothetical protein
MRKLTPRAKWVLALVVAFAAAGRPARASDLPAIVAHDATIDASRLVTVVTADIDADGDLDVIASDSALQLHVWVNDGAGHFTRRDPVRSTAWRPLPPAPSVDGQPIHLESFTQPAPPSLGTDAGPAPWSLHASAPSCAIADRLPSTDSRSTRTPRAPPAA